MTTNNAQSIRERQMAYLASWRTATEKILDSKINNTKQIVLSTIELRHIIVQVLEQVDGFEARIAFRDSLRLQDMGAGAGWHKGTRLSATAYDDVLSKHRLRKQKKLVNRASYARLHWLEDVLGGIITQNSVIESETVDISI